MAAPCVIANTKAALETKTVVVEPLDIPTLIQVLRTAPTAQAIDTACALYDSSTGAFTILANLGGTLVSFDIGTAPTGL